MIEIVPYKAEHLLEMELASDGYQPTITLAIARSLEGPQARTALVDGKPIAAAGLANKWLENWVAWTFLSPAAAPHMLALTRAIKKRMERWPRGRIEAATPIDYRAGRRWLEMLGFKCETPDGMAHYTPDGRVYALYSMVNLS